MFDLDLVVCDQRVANDVKCLRAPLERLNRRRDVLSALDIERRDLKGELGSRFLDLAYIPHGGRIVDIGDVAQSTETANKLAKDFKPFAGKIRLLVRQPRYIAARSVMASWLHSRDRAAI